MAEVKLNHLKKVYDGNGGACVGSDDTYLPGSFPVS